jgi:hypothetical protein
VSRIYFVSIGDISFLSEIFHFYITWRPPEANDTASIPCSIRSSEFHSHCFSFSLHRFLAQVPAVLRARLVRVVCDRHSKSRSCPFHRRLIFLCVSVRHRPAITSLQAPQSLSHQSPVAPFLFSFHINFATVHLGLGSANAVLLCCFSRSRAEPQSSRVIQVIGDQIVISDCRW